MNTAWADIKGGWNNLQTFFKGLAKGLDLDFDLSALKIEDAKLAAFEALDAALKGIKTGWGALTAFGAGAKPYIFDIGDDLGGMANAFGRFADAIRRIVSALYDFGGVDDSKVRSVFGVLGGLAGGSFARAVDLFEEDGGCNRLSCRETRGSRRMVEHQDRLERPSARSQRPQHA
ncbi:hypothetical protein ABWH89_12070 [Hoeflea alexandrii]|uniref:hypothetical protein n=1 Tax=Hoeflea alexandrii TaxID=288436 RepID=UPI0035D0B064